MRGKKLNVDHEAYSEARLLINILLSHLCTPFNWLPLYIYAKLVQLKRTEQPTTTTTSNVNEKPANSNNPIDTATSNDLMELTSTDNTTSAQHTSTLNDNTTTHTSTEAETDKTKKGNEVNNIDNVENGKINNNENINLEIEPGIVPTVSLR